MAESIVVEASEVEIVFDAHAVLGEGPSWDADTGRLLWVDITRGLVHRFDPSDGGDETWPVGQHVGAVVPCTSGSFALALRDGFALLDPWSGEIELIAPVEVDRQDTRMNDGKCDTQGRFWAGTNAYGAVPHQGTLYRVDRNRAVVPVFGGVTIANGLGWSPDDRKMYYIDTAANGIDVLDYDATTGDVVNRRRLVDLPEEIGGGDGMTVDAAGFIWVALWNGGAVHRYSPAGQLDVVVQMPVTHPTSCCFGGLDLGDLYITSASGTDQSRFSSSLLASQPYAGGLFRIRPGVKGLPTNAYCDS
jgi:sugar lactone lactonase YvrE